MKCIILKILVLMILFSACTEIDLPSGAPACLENKIKEYKKRELCDGASVDEFEFQDATVFVLGIGDCCCDQASEVLDMECISIGFLGGFQGNTTINGEEFSNATYIGTIWYK